MEEFVDCRSLTSPHAMDSDLSSIDVAVKMGAAFT
jgi:hypothetical protein